MMRTVPFLADKAIDSATDELLRKVEKRLGRKIEPPVPVDDIIERYLGVTLEITDLEARFGMADVLGAAWFDENIIRVHEGLEAQEGRLCFTMAHEVGHWVLHRPLYEAEKVAPSLFGNRTLPAILCRSSQRPAAEIQADKFAARLLMPSKFVRNAFNAVVGEEPLLVAGMNDAKRRVEPAVLLPWSEVAKDVIAEGGFENVSVEAMRYRLADLNLVRDASVGAQRRLL